MFDDDDEEEFWGPISDPKEGLGPEIPSVRIPDATVSDPDPDPDSDTESDIEVSSDLLVTFWGLVLTLNLALLATSLGAMLAYFRGQLRLGGGLFCLGVVAFGYAYYKYRRYLDRTDTDHTDDATASKSVDSTDSAEDTDDAGGIDGRNGIDR